MRDAGVRCRRRAGARARNAAGARRHDRGAVHAGRRDRRARSSALIDGARDEVLVQAFSFTNRRIARALGAAPRARRARRSGRRPRADARAAGKRRARARARRRAGLARRQLRRRTQQGADHRCGRAAAPRSSPAATTTRSAAQMRNAENVLIVRNDRALAAQYRANFVRLRERAQRYDGAVRALTPARSVADSRYACVHVLAPIDFGVVESTLARRRHIGTGSDARPHSSVCLADRPWLVDRRVAGRARPARMPPTQGRLHGSFARVVFPLTALVLVLFAIGVYRRYVGAPLFLAIAAPMLIALAAIRMIVYGLRRLFKSQALAADVGARDRRSRSGASSSCTSSACCRRSPRRSTTSRSRSASRRYRC